MRGCARFAEAYPRAKHCNANYAEQKRMLHISFLEQQAYYNRPSAAAPRPAIFVISASRGAWLANEFRAGRDPSIGFKVCGSIRQMPCGQGRRWPPEPAANNNSQSGFDKELSSPEFPGRIVGRCAPAPSTGVNHHPLRAAATRGIPCKSGINSTASQPCNKDAISSRWPWPISIHNHPPETSERCASGSNRR